MNNRVSGVLGISSIMANWNADFSGYPKSTSEGTVYGSDKALKYPMKKMWDDEGKKVLYIKSMKFSKEGKKGDITLVPRNLKERYEYLFNVPDLKECKNVEEILRNLMSAVDVKNFGATFAESGRSEEPQEFRLRYCLCRLIEYVRSSPFFWYGMECKACKT